MTAALEAEGLEKRYGARLAVSELTFTAAPGEVLGVLGPNGAGKTTAMRMLTTVVRQTCGSFAVAGVPHTRPVEIRRRIGVLPESAGYPERQTGEEYLRYNARLHGHGRAGARAVARALLEQVDLGERGRSLIAGYSRGMRQRLGIARALVNDPTVVFLDEPTLGLDPLGQRRVLEAVRALARERGATVVLSTHLLAEVEETCHRVLILNAGRMVAHGTVAEVTRRVAAPRSGRVRVAPEQAQRAAAVLAGRPSVVDARLADGEPGWLHIAFAPAGGPGREQPANDAVRALLDEGVELLSFELERARLSDAFLAVTAAA